MVCGNYQKNNIKGGITMENTNKKQKQYKKYRRQKALIEMNETIRAYVTNNGLEIDFAFNKEIKDYIKKANGYRITFLDKDNGELQLVPDVSWKQEAGQVFINISKKQLETIKSNPDWQTVKIELLKDGNPIPNAYLHMERDEFMQYMEYKTRNDYTTYNVEAKKYENEPTVIIPATLTTNNNQIIDGILKIEGWRNTGSPYASIHVVFIPNGKKATIYNVPSVYRTDEGITTNFTIEDLRKIAQIAQTNGTFSQEILLSNGKGNNKKIYKSLLQIDSKTIPPELKEQIYQFIKYLSTIPIKPKTANKYIAKTSKAQQTDTEQENSTKNNATTVSNVTPEPDIEQQAAKEANQIVQELKNKWKEQSHNKTERTNKLSNKQQWKYRR